MTGRGEHMNFIFVRLICLAVGYIFGMFETAYFVGKAYGVDIRQKGSGNTGTTNTLRVLGKKAGLLVFLGDIFKTIFAVIICYFIFREQFPDKIYLIKLYAGFGSILGHNFPFYLKFKGGKGIASMAGLILSFHWMFIPVAFVLFFATFALTNYVSLGSLIMAAGFFGQTVIMGCSGLFKGYDGVEITGAVLYEMYALTFIIMAMGFIRHTENIKKLIRGEERKTYLFKKNKEEIK